MVRPGALAATLPLVLIIGGSAPLSGSSARVAEITVLEVEPGRGRVGVNTIRVELRNEDTVPRPVLLSLRVEGPTRAVQRSHYRLLDAGETVVWTEDYRIPDRSYRLLEVFAGAAEAMPGDDHPYPDFAGEPATRRFVVASSTAERTVGRESAWLFYWDFGGSPSDLADRIERTGRAPDAGLESARARLRELLRWDRDVSTEYSPELLGRDTIGPYRLRTMRISGEAGAPIDFLLFRRGHFDAPLPTVLYLSGNPPGTKESGLVTAMILADAGLQVATVDRREGARRTAPGEFLANIADPVFDARRLVDYLLSRPDVAGSAVSVLGFSAGAYEGMFLAALYPEVSSAVLASRMVAHDSLFRSVAWAPTLWAPEVLRDVGLGDVMDDWRALREALTPEVGERAAATYRRVFPFFERIDPVESLPLAVPKPVLLITGALDSQFPLGGVLAVDQAMRKIYGERGVLDASSLYVMPRTGHALTPQAMDRAAVWLRLWSPSGLTGRAP